MRRSSLCATTITGAASRLSSASSSAIFRTAQLQLLAIRRGDIDIAFNLIPEQIATIKDNKDVRVEGLTSLDFVYMALTQNPEFNKALAVKEARQAIGCAIDYDGIIANLCGGAAVRPANFLPIGVNGSTEEIAKELRYKQDLDKAKKLLQQAGLADGFEFEIAYGNAAVAGVTYQMLAQKIQGDLARVGIRVKLNPMDQVNLRTTYTGAKAQGGVLTFWNPPAVENLLWAAATVERVARRVHWKVPPATDKLVREAAAQEDLKKAADLWVEYQKKVVDEADYFILFQPIYQIAVRNTLAKLPLTAAGWQPTWATSSRPDAQENHRRGGSRRRVDDAISAARAQIREHPSHPRQRNAPPVLWRGRVGGVAGAWRGEPA